MADTQIAVVISRYYLAIADGLLAGACQYLAEKNIAVDSHDIFEAPGAFEIPLIAAEVARTGRYAGVICLGCVIKGDTAHFEWIGLGATVGLQQAIQETRTPIAFGILTTYTQAQAESRSTVGLHNKGREAANAVWNSVQTLRRIRKA